ncbi:MAG: hypothetical protein AABY30_05520, partial [Candidatus Thermoplasmatota archaeon]
MDPRLASANAVIADTMRRAGLNALSRPSSGSDILQQRNARLFDLYIAEWRIQDVDPDYLVGAFHDGFRDGANHAGLANATVDGVLEESRRALDRTARQGFIFEAQELLAELRPAEPLFFRTRVEAYREDRFVNWTVEWGTLWTERSLLGVRTPPIPDAPRASVSAPSAVRANETVDVSVTVRTPLGLLLPGASVQLSVTDGNLTLAGATNRTVAGITAADGRLVAVFRAPPAAEETPVFVLATATHPDYRDAGAAGATIRVFPGGAKFLSLFLELPLGDLASPGDALPMRIDVRDQDRAIVADALVEVTSGDPSRVRPQPSNGTAGAMGSVLLQVDATNRTN